MKHDNPAVLAEGGKDNVWGGGLRASAFFVERVAPWKEFFGGWHGTINVEDRNVSFSQGVAEIFAGKSGWEVSAGVLEELAAVGNRDAVEVIRLLRNKQDLPVGNRYETELEGSGYVAWQLRLAKGADLPWVPGLSAGAAVALLYGQRIQEGTVEGPFTITGRRAYDYSLALNYNYDVNYLYDYDFSRSGMEGWGYSVSLGARYQRGGLDVSLYGEDLFSHIYWSGVPTTTAIANNGRRYFDSDGFVHYNPIITGFEGKTQVTQHLEEKISGQILYSWDRVRVLGGSAWTMDTYFPYVALGGRWSRTAGWWSLVYDVYFQMVGLQYGGKNVQFAIYSDAIQPDHISSAGFRVAVSW